MCQETFLRAFRALPAFRGQAKFSSWLYRIALNVARDLQRSAWHRRVVPLGGAGTTLVGKELSPPQALEKQEAKERLRQAIMNLRQDEKEVFLLRQNGSLTFEQIAGLTGVSSSTAHRRYLAALSALRERLRVPCPKHPTTWT